ncbi:hypothetical protein Tco_0370508 [Tanacetum coccineum]
MDSVETTPVESGEHLETNHDEKSELSKTKVMRQAGIDRLRMVYTRAEGIDDTEMGLDTADTLCFQLGRARRSMPWRKFILLITCSIAGRSHALEKVISADLFYLRSMDVGSVNISYLLLGIKSFYKIMLLKDLILLVVIPDAAAGAPKDVEGAHAEVEGNQAVLAPVQAPQPPSTTT